MELQRALEILNALADGMDPVTGAIFLKDSPYQHPDIVRALYAVLDCFKPKKSKAKRMMTPCAFKTWKPSEDKRLIEAFDAHHPIQLITEKHQRTVGSIAARLVRLGKIKERSDIYNRKENYLLDE